MRAQKRARATGIVLAGKVISARRFSPVVRLGKLNRVVAQTRIYLARKYFFGSLLQARISRSGTLPLMARGFIKGDLYGYVQ